MACRSQLSFDPILDLYCFDEGTQAALHSDSIQNNPPIFSSDKGVVFVPKISGNSFKLPSLLGMKPAAGGAQCHPFLESMDNGSGEQSWVLDQKDGHVVVSSPQEEGFGFVGHLEMDLLGEEDQWLKTYIGSSCQVGVHVAFTAAHNLYSRYYKKPLSRVECHMARVGDHIPHKAEAVTFVVHPQFIEGTEEEAKKHDIAVVLFNRPLGQEVGHVPYVSMADEELIKEVLTVVGYPSAIHKEGVWTLVNGAHMAYMEGRVEKVTPHQIFYKINTVPGQSGGGVLNKKKKLCAIHAYGPYGGEESNRATRLSPETITWLRGWAARFETYILSKEFPMWGGEDAGDDPRGMKSKDQEIMTELEEKALVELEGPEPSNQKEKE
ncbi:MAG: trypsin-like serine peptidase [Alphaproteobacteria bacterium]